MNGIDSLGSILQSQMKYVNTQNKELSLCLGTVRGSSIVVDGLEWTLPKGDYMVTAGLSMPATAVTSTEEGHSHTVSTGATGLQSGARVLIAWVGHEPVVIDVVRSS